MQIWSAEIKELESLYTSIKGQFPELEKELEQLIATKDANVVMLYSRRCLEVIISDLCECELKRPRKTEPLKGIIDKLNREEKVPAHIVASMYSLNSLSTFGAHPKEFDPRQVKPVLNNLSTVIDWYLKYNSIEINVVGKDEEEYSRISPEKKKFTISENGTMQKKSIIVLPFENMSPDPDQEYFSDGLTEEIITDLSHITDLLVISRSSAMIFKGAKVTIKEITDKVNVRYVLEGSVRKAGNNLRITAQLIDGMTDTHIWAEKYEETLENVFHVQEKISGLITKSLQIRLTKGEKEKYKYSSASDLIAKECWFRAKQEIHRYTPESFGRAHAILENGLKENGENELLLWGLGYLNWFYVNMGISLDDTFLQKAEYYVEKIFNLNKESFYGYQLQGMIAYKRGDTKKSIFYTKKALEIEPNNPEALDHIIRMYADTGKTHKAYELIERLLAVDPLTSHNHWAKAWTLALDGKFKESLPACSKALELDPQNIVWNLLYAWDLLMTNQVDEAIEFIAPLERDYHDTIYKNFIVFTKNVFLKDHAKTLQALTDDILKFGEWDEGISLMLAQSFAMINEKEKALYWIEHLVNRGFINYPFLSEYNFTLDNIRNEERFIRLMKKVKNEWENFEV
jgi:TolB-like protein